MMTTSDAQSLYRVTASLPQADPATASCPDPFWKTSAASDQGFGQFPITTGEYFPFTGVREQSDASGTVTSKR